MAIRVPFTAAALAGLASFAFFGVLTALPVGAGCVVAAVAASSLPLLAMAALAGGTGAGLALRSALAIITGIARVNCAAK